MIHEGLDYSQERNAKTHEKEMGNRVVEQLICAKEHHAKGYMDEIADFLQNLHPHQKVQP